MNYLTSGFKYYAGFQRVGAVYDESIVLLSEYGHCGDWEIVVEKVISENLLKKGSSLWLKHILRAARRRFFVGGGFLPGGEQVSKFMLCDVPKFSKVQVLYQYVCNSDALVDRVLTGLVGPALMQFGTLKLTKQVFFAFMDKEAERHPELGSWSSEVRETWQRKFFTFLRYSGIMEAAPSVVVRKPVVRVEPFTFFLYGLLDKGLSGIEVIRSPLWERYFLSEEDVENVVSSAQEKGWIDYRRLGSIVELTKRFNSLEEWMNGALGCR